jgi:hypothetical protein
MHISILPYGFPTCVVNFQHVNGNGIACIAEEYIYILESMHYKG